MLHIPSFGSIYNLGHKALIGFFDESVQITEKIDGSFFAFAKINGQYCCRSKGQQLIVDNPEKLFSKAVQNTKNLDLKEGYIYYGEALNSPSHNTLKYNRVPNNNVILFAIDKGEQDFLPYLEMVEDGRRIGLETAPLYYESKIDNLDLLKTFLDKESVLGGTKIEGVVLKRFDIFGPDKKILMAKLVSEAFKEVHNIEWKKNNPTKTDIIESIIKSLQTDARYNKAVQHLNEKGQINRELKDIGRLIKEVKEDILKEEAENIKELLFNSFKEQILRGASSYVVNWYKEKLAKTQF